MLGDRTAEKKEKSKFVERESDENLRFVNVRL